jgi:hypothetical protein
MSGEANTNFGGSRATHKNISRRTTTCGPVLQIGSLMLYSTDSQTGPKIRLAQASQTTSHFSPSISRPRHDCPCPLQVAISAIGNLLVDEEIATAIVTRQQIGLRRTTVEASPFRNNFGKKTRRSGKRRGSVAWPCRASELWCGRWESNPTPIAAKLLIPLVDYTR